ncbi:hypothetical protein [Pandoraea sp. NPDC087047]|uniref:hypothetical protein n=1 Tax=Pandoraea sp. NPDC087047 TaxID=3364390 RepID=UPI00380B6675
MNFKDLFSQLHRVEAPLEAFKKLSPTACRPKPKASDVDEALRALSYNVSRNKTGTALSVARALLILLGPEKAISRIQRDGVFRASHYSFNSPAVQAVVADWADNAVLYGLSETDADYLRSVKALWSLAPCLQWARRSLVDRMRSRQSVAIKTLLAHVDLAFAYGMPGNTELSTESADAYSSEAMAEAFSYLLRLFHLELGITAQHFRMVDDSAVSNTFYQDMLVDAAKICEYLEAEVLVDAFPYSATASGSEIRISADDPMLEKSIRAGYIQSDMQKAIRLRALMEHGKAQDQEILSVTNLAQIYYEKLGEQVIHFVSKPVPRYVSMLPLVDELLRPFSGNGLFLEDLFSIEMLGTEDYVAPSEIIDSPVVGNISVIDILKVQRFFYFMQLGFRRAIDRHSPVTDRPNVYLTSCLPVFEHQKLMVILGKLLGDEKAAEMLQFLTCDLSSDYIDLQYTPIISSGGWYMLSLVVLSGSNLVRNLLCHHAKRLTMREKIDQDPMQAALKSALQEAGFLVEMEVDTGTKNNKLEVDVLAYRDGHLFLFECKNSFHPCNVYEMRTSFDHVAHAANQLTQRKTWLSKSENQRRVFDTLSWTVAPAANVHTCIAIGNRVFTGYECEGHPVRQVHEMLNLLRRGYIVIQDVSRRLWQSDHFSVDDLCAHLAGTTTVADFMTAMQPLDRTLSFGTSRLTFSTYMLDGRDLSTIAEARYPCIEFTTGAATQSIED